MKRSQMFLRFVVIPTTTVAIAVVLRMATERWLTANIPFGPFFLAVAVCALFGGFRSALVATTLSITAVSLFSLESKHALPTGVSEEAGSLLVFFGISLMIAYLGHVSQRARATAQNRASEAIELAKRLDLHRAALEAVGNSVVITDVQGNIVWVNPAFTDLTGYTFGEALGKNPRILKSERQPAQYYTELWRTILSGQTWQGELINRRKDGSVYTEAISITPVRDVTTKAITHFVAIKQDITERYRAREALLASEARFRIVQELSPDGFTILRPVRNEDGRVIDFIWLYQNDAIARLNGTDPKEVLGRRLSEVLPSHVDTPFHAVYQEVAQTGETKVLEAPYQREPGANLIWFRVAAVAMDGDIAVLAHEITEQKRTEEELRRAKRELESTNAAKDHFLAALSHELRTPLSPIFGAVKLLERQENLSADAREYVDMIRRNMEVEVRLIDDMLDLTRIARGKISLETGMLDISTVLQRVSDVCRADINEKKLHFAVEVRDPPRPVQGDFARLQQVFWNILKNSIKFTPEGGCVQLHCRNAGGNVVVEITDSGIGIEAKALPKIFDAFEQTDPRITKHFGGLGLGLAISKRLVEMHGGTISAESQGRNRGATFRVTLPAAHGVSAEMPPVS